MRKVCLSAISLLLLVNFWACNLLEILDPPGITISMEVDTVIFAVIGDYGKAGVSEQAVSDLVKCWQPDFIITTGDNNYEYGDYSTIKQNISQYYGDYIYNFDAPDEYQCRGTAFKEEVNRFFPSPGNHDQAGSQSLEPYLNFLTLPGKEEYYLFSWGPAAFYSINSLSSADHEAQKIWLEEELRNSTRKFNVVYFHHPPYSPGKHGDTGYMQWDFHGWGADVVLSGHDHIYARLENQEEAGLTYIINGLGGKSTYTCDGDYLAPSVLPVICFNENYGAMRCSVTPDRLVMAFYSIDNPHIPVDQLKIPANHRDTFQRKGLGEGQSGRLFIQD